MQTTSMSGRAASSPMLPPAKGTPCFRANARVFSGLREATPASRAPASPAMAWA